jgi:NLR family CARD domain-containing protein 3
VGVEPPLPPNIEEILASPCPFWPEKRVCETHLLVLIPAAVNGHPFTLDYLSELIQVPKNGGHATKYRAYWEDLKEQEGKKSVERSYWVLMTRDVVPGTRDKIYSDQKEILEEKARGTALLSDGKVPTLLEAAASILMEYVRTGRRLYGDKPWTFTFCQEAVRGFNSVSGGFSSAGLSLHSSISVHETHGLACCRKFLSH